MLINIYSRDRVVIPQLRIEGKRFILTITLIVILSVNANSQIVRKMSISDMFQLAESNSRELNSQRTGVEVAKEGVKVAKSRLSLPDINVKLNANYMGNILYDRDFTNVHGYSAFHFGNEFAVDAQPGGFMPVEQ